MRRIICFAIIALAASACGPIDYINTVTLKASRAVSEAKAANAEKLAPYEYWSARTYLLMAREMGARADFEHSIDYGEKAQKMAQQARKLASEKGEEGPDAQRIKQAPVQVVPGTDTPAVETPAAANPAPEKPAADKPAADKPAADKPAADKPAAETPAGDKEGGQP